MENNIEILTIKDAQRGSEQAWKELFRMNFEAIYQYSLNLTSGRRDMAEEVTQQVFMTAAARIGRFRPQRGTFRAWLMGIAKNKAKKVVSKEKKQAKLISQVLENNSTVRNRYQETFVYEVLAKLPPHYRAVLEEKYLKGFKIDEIAQANNSTPKAVESLLARARDKFAQVLKEMKDKNII
jgi:RNA polymerase sigma-70 factor (ECF subfamily)